VQGQAQVQVHFGLVDRSRVNVANPVDCDLNHSNHDVNRTNDLTVSAVVEMRAVPRRFRLRESATPTPTATPEKKELSLMRLHLIRRAAATTVAAAAVLAGAGSIAAANASTTLYVKLSATTDGATATCNAAGDIVLTTGLVTGSTYAQAVVQGIAGTAVPTTEPSFTTTNYAAGSPRWVIDLSDGATLFSNQTNATSGWEYNTGSGWQGYGDTYAQAVAAAVGTATNVTVKDAYIVADGDQAPGTEDVLTAVTYNGDPVSCATPPVTKTIPSVAGQRATQALAAIRAAGFQAITNPLRNPKYTYVAVSTTPSGSAAVGSLVVVNVKVVTPAGPSVKIPNVTGQRANPALTALRAAGFQAVTSPLRNPKYAYVVTGTSPTGSAPKGALVTVFVKRV